MLKSEDFKREYHKILSSEVPHFFEKYLDLEILKRLSGVGLLCGTDWTRLYLNNFYYSRLDHSIGSALITWNFTHDKKQTLSSLFHDVATGVFSHVNDFRKGDALKQEISENQTEQILKNEKKLYSLLKEDKIDLEEISDYHKYSVCDNEIPRLSSDRLEYMFPSNMIFSKKIKGKVWNLGEIKSIYKNIEILKNEDNENELGFSDEKKALLYTEGFCSCAKILQKNENKLSLSFLGKIMNLALENKIITEKDCFSKSEREIIAIFDDFAQRNKTSSFEEKRLLSRMILTWRKMKKVHSFSKEKNSEWFTVNLKVKKRYIDPLVKIEGKTERLSKVNEKASKIIENYLDFEDKPFGAVKLIK